MKIFQHFHPNLKLFQKVIYFIPHFQIDKSNQQVPRGNEADTFLSWKC